jgi:type IV pilus assembly protein PilW
MHQGLDIAGGAGGAPDGNIDDKDAVPVAEGIEQLQLAYIMNVLHTSNGTDEAKVPRIIGMDNLQIPLAGNPVTWPYGEAWALTFGVDAPAYEDAYDSPKRVTAHPANIRQVRVTLVSRSNVPDAQMARDPKYNGDNALNPTTETWTSGTYGGTTTWSQLENLGTPPANSPYDPRGRGFYRVVLRQTIVPKNMLSRSQFLPVSEGGG